MRQYIFISSVQKEFARERKALGAYLAGDPMLVRFYDTFLFEHDVPASDRRPDAVYLDKVATCNLYLGLFGDEYGKQNKDGISATHLEFKEATRLGKTRLIFVKGSTDANRHPKMRRLIHKAGRQLIRRRFNNSAELHTAVYASLVDYLEATGALNYVPWDTRAAGKATLDDLDPKAIIRFVQRARKARNFPFSAESEIEAVLTHLNLLDNGVPTNAAILLFGKHPQRFTQPSEVKCAHFHGTEVAKPIPSYQVYKGTAFELVDQAIDFVMSKINLSVGTRKHGPQAPVKYEIPREVVAEAIVNAIVHRDYNSNGSVQVMLFPNRLEVWNPGTLPPALTLDKLRAPHSSIPGNPLLAEPLYLTKYIERMGTGTRDMIRRCRAAGLPEPGFSLTDSFVTTVWRPAGQVRARLGLRATRETGQVGTKLGLSRDQVKILRKCMKSKTMMDIMEITGRTNRTKFRDQVLRPLLDEGLVAMTILGKPQSPRQRYQTTSQGREAIKGAGRR